MLHQTINFFCCQFIDIKVTTVAPSVQTMIFGYVSVSTLGATPVWSTQDGNDIVFTLYDKGERIRSYEYEVRRSAFLWLGMLPVAWVNFFTPSEKNVFTAITHQFFLDMKQDLSMPVAM